MNKLIASTLTLTMIALMGTTGIGMAGNPTGIEVAEKNAPVEESSDMQSAPEESVETDSITEENAETDSSMTEEDMGVEEDTAEEDVNDQSSQYQDTDAQEPASEWTEPEDYAHEQQSRISDYGTESIYGTVTLVGDNVIKLQDSATGIGYTIHVSEKQEKELTTGFMIDAKVKDGKLVAFTQLDVPANVEEIVYSAENLS